MTKKISPEEFVRLAILKLRTGSFKGIHTIYSGFNEAFRKYFNGEDPVKLTNRLAEEGKIALRPVKGGVILYLSEDAPSSSKGDQALQKMGLL